MKEALQISTGACVIACGLLIAMLVAPWSFDFGFPGSEVLTGERVLTTAQLVRYHDALAFQYALDTLFIACWLAAWIALSVVVFRTDRALGALALILGLPGPLLDIGENAIVWYQLLVIENSLPADLHIHLFWQIVRQSSYLLPFIAAPVLLIGLWRSHMLNTSILWLALTATAIAICGVYLTQIAWMADLWWLLFFLTGALLSIRALIQIRQRAAS